MEKVFKEKYKVLFADLDGTLIDTVSGNTFPKGIWDMRIRFDVLDAIKKLDPDYILIVSNQGGIEKGFVNQQNFQAKSEYIGIAISEYCGCECYVMYCTSNDKSDPYRKPNPAMLEHLSETYVGDDFDYIKSVSIMIGDASGKEGQFSDSDKKTAENFGIDYMDVEDFVKRMSYENIIKKGALPPKEKKMTCRKCGCVFMYERADIHSDQREGCWVVCPTCKKYINVDGRW